LLQFRLRVAYVGQGFFHRSLDGVRLCSFEGLSCPGHFTVMLLLQVLLGSIYGVRVGQTKGLFKFL
jgi:hypothetical protein